MTKRERRDKELVLRNAFRQIHLTVIEEDIKDLVANGTEQERVEYVVVLEKLKEPLLSAKLRAAA